MNTLKQLIGKATSIFTAGTANGFELTDGDCAQACREEPLGYHFVEIRECAGETGKAVLVSGLIHPEDYSDGELWYYGSFYYSDRAEFDQIPLSVQLECVFESDPSAYSVVLADDFLHIFSMYRAIIESNAGD